MATKDELKAERDQLQKQVGQLEQQVDQLQRKIEMKDNVILDQSEQITNLKTTINQIEQALPEEILQQLSGEAEPAEDGEF